jgi:hypothetical protein
MVIVLQVALEVAGKAVPPDKNQMEVGELREAQGKDQLGSSPIKDHLIIDYILLVEELELQMYQRIDNLELLKDFQTQEGQ